MKDDIIKSLSSSENVMVNMIKGTIALLSVRQFIKARGETVINGDDNQLLEITKLRQQLKEREDIVKIATEIVSNFKKAEDERGYQFKETFVHPESQKETVNGVTVNVSLLNRLSKALNDEKMK